MAQIELPRPLQDYFAFAELPAGPQGRRFTLTFPYFEDQRLDRLQWWWQVGSTQERIGGEEQVERLREEAIDRFRVHIERWLGTSQRRLFDGHPFPRLGQLAAAVAPGVPEAPLEALPAWPVEQVANG